MPDLLERLRAALADRYAVESEVGRGGMAVVFRAEDLKHHREVAIKVLHPDLAATVGADRFLREIEIVAGLHHPHILPLYESGEADGLLYFVMPYVEGESLRQRLERDKQLPVEEALTIASEVCDGLAFAHDKGVVHRDIKPANILLSAGHATIADFGVARAIDLAGGDKTTATGLAVGTPIYVAPEQASGHGRGDERSDIYSVGCLLYEMLVGEPPYSGLTPQTLLARKMSESAPRIRAVRDTVSPRVDEVVSRCLARVPADRYQTARDLRDALENSKRVASGRLSSDSATHSIAGSRPTRRVGAVVIAVLAAVALIYVGLAALGLGRRPVGDVPKLGSLIVLPLDNLSEDREQEYFAVGLADVLTSAFARSGAFHTVISTASASRYANVDIPVPEIARQVGVDAVMEGRTVRAGDTVRITLQLVHGPTSRVLWNGEYTEAWTNVIALQNQVSREVVDSVQLTLSPAGSDRLLQEPHYPDQQALEAYWKGRHQTFQYTREGAELAQAFFQQAIALDPDYAPPYAALAEVYCVASSLVEDDVAFRDECERLALKALELNPELAEAHSALGLVRVLHWDWTGAEAAFKRAIELNPSALSAHIWYGWFLSQMMRLDESLTMVRRAERLDPLNPFAKMIVVAPLLNGHRYDEAQDQLDEVAQMWPDFPQLYIYRAGILSLQGKLDLALEAADRIAPGTPQKFWVRGMIHALKGREERALEIVVHMQEEFGEAGTAAGAAIVLLALGREQEALDKLELGYRAGNIWMPLSTSWPQFDALRDNPRFRELRRAMGLEGH